MGWLGTDKPFHGDKKRWLIDEYSHDGEIGTNPSYSLTDVSVRGRESYGILHIIRADGTKYGLGMVFLVESKDGQWFVKDMSEDSMPYYFNAPLTLINKLDAMYPPVNDYAKQWRDKCRANAVKKKIKLKHGDVCKFSNPIKLANGKSYETLTYVDYPNKRNIFKTDDSYGLVRLPNLAKREFTILEKDNA